jgi:hypothetical protein
MDALPPGVSIKMALDKWLLSPSVIETLLPPENSGSCPFSSSNTTLADSLPLIVIWGAICSIIRTIIIILISEARYYDIVTILCA